MNIHSEMQIIESSTRKLLPGSLGKNMTQQTRGGGCILLHLVTGKKPSETLGKDCTFSSPVLGVSVNKLVSSEHSQSWKTDQHTTRVSTSSTESFLHSRYKLHMLLILFWFTVSMPCSVGAVTFTHMFQAYKRLSELCILGKKKLKWFGSRYIILQEKYFITKWYLFPVNEDRLSTSGHKGL